MTNTATNTNDLISDFYTRNTKNSIVSSLLYHTLSIKIFVILFSLWKVVILNHTNVKDGKQIMFNYLVCVIASRRSYLGARTRMWCNCQRYLVHCGTVDRWHHTRILCDKCFGQNQLKSVSICISWFQQIQAKTQHNIPWYITKQIIVYFFVIFFKSNF